MGGGFASMGEIAGNKSRPGENQEGG